MADPLTIVGSIASVVGIIDTVAKTITTIRTLQTQWKEANLTLMSFESQLGALDVALLKIQEWMESDPDDAHHLLILNLTNTLQCCEALIGKLYEELSELTYGSSGPPDTGSKIKLLLNSGALGQISKMIESQTSALLLLLTACNTATLSSQSKILQRKSARKTLESVREQSASLLAHRDTTSLLSSYTDTLSRRSMIFDFDHELFRTKVYESVVRNALRSALRFQPARSRTHSLKQESRLGSVAERLEDISECPSKGYTKVLILGGPGSSKSTIVKQLRSLYSDGFTGFERKQWRDTIVDSISTALQTVLRQMVERPDLQSSLAETTQDPDIWTSDGILDFIHYGIFVDFDDERSCKIWADRIKSVLSLAREVFEEVFFSGVAYSVLGDDVEYLLRDIDTLMSPSYLPSNADIFHASTPTTGIHENRFTVNGQEFRVFEVGGTYSERLKWVHAFEDVDVLIFLASSNGSTGESDQDQTMLIPESMRLFESLSTSKWFVSARKFLVLTKSDLLEAKMWDLMDPVEGLEDFYGDPFDVAAVHDYLKQEFTRSYTGRDAIITHHIDATSTADVQSLWDLVVKYATPKYPASVRRSMVLGPKSSGVVTQVQKGSWVPF